MASVEISVFWLELRCYICVHCRFINTKITVEYYSTHIRMYHMRNMELVRVNAYAESCHCCCCSNNLWCLVFICKCWLLYIHVLYVCKLVLHEPESGKSLISDFEMHWPKIRIVYSTAPLPQPHIKYMFIVSNEWDRIDRAGGYVRKKREHRGLKKRSLSANNSNGNELQWRQTIPKIEMYDLKMLRAFQLPYLPVLLHHTFIYILRLYVWAQWYEYEQNISIHIVTSLRNDR